MMGRSPNCRSCSNDDDHQGFIRGAWTAKEDTILSEYIKTHGVGRWRSLPKKAGLKRCGKSCRLRWLNYLRPDINHGNISPEEEELLIRLHRLLGNRWSLIAGRLPGRTENEIKNYWNTHLRKKVEISGLEPKSQKPFKSCRDMPYYSDYKEQEVKDKDNSISQTTPLKTRSVRYCGRVIADVNNCNNDNYDLIQDAHGGINPQEKGLKATDDHVVEVDTSKSFKVADDHVVEIDTSKSFKAEDDHVVEIDTSRSFKAADNHGVDIDTSKSFKVADDHVVEIDTSKSWCQLLLEDCIGDEKYDRLEVIDGLQKNNIVRTQSLGIEDHLHAQFPYPTHNYEIHSSYYSSFEDQEFPHSIYFESFLDLSELPSFLS